MMGGLARSVGMTVLGAVCACNAITGVDALDTSTGSDESQLPSRRHEDTTSSSSSSGEQLASSSSTSSGGGSSSGATNDPDASTTNDAGSDAPIVVGGNGDFFDAFERADNAAVGNGWIEKTDHFAILGGGVKQTGIGSYKDLFVRRPASEDALDVEISVDVKHNAVDGDPCLYARVQPASSNPNTLVSYTFYAYSDYVYLDRDEGGDKMFKELASQAISPAFTAPYSYSLSLKVTGTNPVHVVGVVKDSNGNVKNTLDVLDADPTRIATSGGVAFGSGGADGARFDNFKRTKL